MAKRLIGRGRYCCITGEWAADDLPARVVVDTDMFPYKVALVHEFISALLRWTVRSSASGHLRSQAAAREDSSATVTLEEAAIAARKQTAKWPANHVAQQLATSRNLNDSVVEAINDGFGLRTLRVEVDRTRREVQSTSYPGNNPTAL